MNIATLKEHLRLMGAPYPAVLDYLDCEQQPTVAGFWEYLKNEQSAYDSQVRWDARFRKQAIGQSNESNADGFASMLNQVRRGS